MIALQPAPYKTFSILCNRGEWLSLKELQALYGIKKRNPVRAHLKSLAKLGFVEVEPKNALERRGDFRTRSVASLSSAREITPAETAKIASEKRMLSMARRADGSSDAQERKCLKCRKPFFSTWKGHRICTPCNTTNQKINNNMGDDW